MPASAKGQQAKVYAADEAEGKLGVPKPTEGFSPEAANGHAAGIIYVAPGGDILLLRRSGQEANFAGHWGLPGGKGEEGETPEETADREAHEEMKLIPESAHRMRLMDSRLTATGMAFHTFAQAVPAKFVPDLNEEHTGFAWVPIGDLPEPVHPGLLQTLTDCIGMTDSLGDGDFSDLRGNFEGWVFAPETAADELAMDWRGALGLRTGDETETVLAFDRSSVRRYDTDGHLHLETSNISKANVCPYHGREIPNWEDLGLSADRIYNLYRDPDELKRGAETFNRLQILSRHVPVTASNRRPDLVIGTTGSEADFDGTYLTNSLVFWAADAISDIEDETKKELSSGYRYRADMTPGEVDGVRFDGVMRDIVGNHVALVTAGRAGSDVVVMDQKPPIPHQSDISPEASPQSQEKDMAKPMLTRKAAQVKDVLSFNLKLAQDAKVDLNSVLAGVTAKNFKQKKSGIADAFKGKLAQDADIDDVVELLDKLEAIEPAEIIEEATGASGSEEVAEDDTDDAMAYLKGKLSEEDFAKFCELQSAGGAADEGDDDDDKKDKDMVTKPAMDAAIADAVRKATSNTMKTQQAIREAERFVRPWVGELAMAHDSAEGVYRTALSTLGVSAEGIHADALRPILEAQQKPGEVKKVIPIAQDAAGAKAYAERFPHANRLK